jgi:RNA polymerase sigma-70 factor, ECF subfamily
MTQDLVAESATYRRELTAYCYRMLGGASEAEDAVQETMLRAWRAADSFEGRSSLRSWLYRIATNICLDMRRAPQRRAMPMDLAGPVTADGDLGRPLEETAFVEPIHDSRVLPETSDPAELAAARDSVRLAFVAALQHLPARQRAVLVLREVLDWSAAEVAELLNTTVTSVNSALARARTTMAKLERPATKPGEDQAELLKKYMAAFEAYDVKTLVSLMHEDIEFSMPPFLLWLRGPEEVYRWYYGQGDVCRDSRMVATSANGMPAFAAYHPTAPGRWEPWALHVLTIDGDTISGICHFLDTSIFPAFDLPPYLEA